MRKLLTALTIMFFMAGLVIAAEVTVTGYDKDKKALTVKDGDAEKTYTIGDGAKITKTDKDGNATEVKFEDFEKRLSEKAVKSGKLKLDIKTADGKITEISYKGGKGK
jgi:hypothetical protein